MKLSQKIILITLLTALTDRLVKFFLDSLPKIDFGFLQIVPRQLNQQLALSLPINNNIAIVISFVVITTIIIWFKNFRLVEQTYLAIIIGAAISNLIDRVVYGGVIDYINFFDISTINLADIFIVIACIGLIYEQNKKSLTK